MNLTLILEIITDFSLAIWFGSMVFFSFIGAPKIFQVLDENKAGEVVNSIFPVYYLLGITAGSIAFLCSILRISQQYKLSLVITASGSFIGAVIFIYSRQILMPKIDRSEEKFEKLHKVSVKLNGIVLITIFISLLSSQI